MLVESWEQPLHTANLATGKIKVFQTIKGITLLLTLPIAYIALRKGAPSEVVFIIQFFVTLGSLIIQLFILRPLIGLSLRRYYLEVFGRTFVVTVTASVIPLLLFYFMPDTILSMIIIILVSVLSVAVFVYLMGLNKPEKTFVINSIKNTIGKLSRKTQ